MRLIIDIPEDAKKSIENGSFGAKYTLYDICGWVMNGEQQKVGKWIPCKDRLPIDNETVLVTGKMKYSWETEYEYFVDCAFVGALHGTPNKFSPFDFETWNDWYEGQDEYYILSWMPLPEPWKEGEEH